MKKRIVILAFDGLEYELVKKMKLKNLLQKEFGKVDISNFKYLITPILWASFITGLSPSEHKVIPGGLTRIGTIQSLINKIMMKLYLDKFNLFWSLIEILKIQNKFNHTKKNYYLKGIKTIFEEFEKSIPLFIPTYNPYFKKRALTLLNSIGNRKLELKLSNYIWNDMEYKRKTGLNIINKYNFKLFMIYFNFTDILAHLYIGNFKKMKIIYKKADQISKDFKNNLKKDTLFLIISDHGMQPIIKKGIYGSHSKYAFYSINYKLNLKYPKLTDFKNIILNY